jgi:hypothetical protein
LRRLRCISHEAPLQLVRAASSPLSHAIVQSRDGTIYAAAVAEAAVWYQLVVQNSWCAKLVVQRGAGGTISNA